MRKTEMIPKHTFYCDRCGKEIKGDSNFFFTAHGNASYANGVVVVYESKIEGEYCKECNEIIARVFSDLVAPVFSERYSKTNDKAIWDYAEQHDLLTDDY